MSTTVSANDSTDWNSEGLVVGGWISELAGANKGAVQSEVLEDRSGGPFANQIRIYGPKCPTVANREPIVCKELHTVSHGETDFKTGPFGRSGTPPGPLVASDRPLSP